jgi:thioredoxin
MGLMLAFAMGKPMPAVPNSPHIISIATSGELDAFTGPGAPPVVLKFYSDTCPPCRQLAPILNKLAEEYASRVKTLAVNIGNTPEIAEPFAVRAVPTVLFLKGGKEVDRLVGLHPESDYRKAWDALLPPS